MAEWLTANFNSILAGLISGSIVSVVFYLLSGRQLRREALMLRALSVLLLRALKYQGVAEIRLDEEGEPIGLNFMKDLFGSMVPKGELNKSIQKTVGGTVSPSGQITARVFKRGELEKEITRILALVNDNQSDSSIEPNHPDN